MEIRQKSREDERIWEAEPPKLCGYYWVFSENSGSRVADIAFVTFGHAAYDESYEERPDLELVIRSIHNGTIIPVSRVPPDVLWWGPLTVPGVDCILTPNGVCEVPVGVKMPPTKDQESGDDGERVSPESNGHE